MRNLMRKLTTKPSAGFATNDAVQSAAKASAGRTLSHVAEALLSPKTLMTLLAFGAITAIMPEMVYANPLMDNQITQGILSFATDVGPWLAGVSIAVGVANCGYCLFRRANCDETDTKRWNDKIKTTIICSGAAAVVTGALPPVLNHYFGVS